MMHSMSNGRSLARTLLCEARGGGVCSDTRESWSPRADRRATRVLVVDGDDSVYHALETASRDGAMEVVHEIEAAAALDRAGFAELDVIVLDLRDRDGMSVLADLRRLHPRVPVLVTTERSDVDLRREALARGADDTLVRSFMHVELIARIRALGTSTWSRRGESIALDNDQACA